jgi:hypothetical protein
MYFEPTVRRDGNSTCSAIAASTVTCAGQWGSPPGGGGYDGLWRLELGSDTLRDSLRPLAGVNIYSA